MRELATHQKILIEAQDLIQRFGFFGLSLQDLADRIHIRKPSLYAHYDSKENLGVSVILEYDRQFRKWTDRIQNETPEFKLQEFYKLFESYLLAGKVCPNSSLGLEGDRLPASMRKAYLDFLEVQITWIERMIREGQERNHFRSTRAPKELAELALQQTVGAQLMSRISGDLSWFYRGSEEILKLIRGDQAETPSAVAGSTLTN
jgi:TetR/AcrR family transcriptional repressor of nem operon